MTSKYESDLSKLVASVEALNSKKTYTKDEDDRYWKLGKDKTGNGAAVIRFLPELPKELPYVRLYNHWFQIKETGKWVIGNCPTTIDGNSCPCCEMYLENWVENDKAAQAYANTFKRKLNYISNILVISDPINPENEGKVFLFRYGKKIYDKLMSKVKPLYEFEQALNPFNIQSGANFILQANTVILDPTKKTTTLSYDQSSFQTPSDLTTMDNLDEIMESRYSLFDLISEDKLDTYESMSKKLEKALTGKAQAKTQEAVNSKNQTSEEASVVQQEEPKLKVDTPKSTKSTKQVEPDEDDEDDSEYFERLAKM